MAVQHAQPLMEVKVLYTCESIWDHAWFRVSTIQAAAAFVQNPAAFQCASRCLTRSSKAETDCCHLQDGKCAFHAEQQCCSPLSSRKYQVSRGVHGCKIHLGAVARRQSLFVFLHAQCIGQGPGSAQAQKRELLCCSCPTPFSSPWAYPPYL